MSSHNFEGPLVEKARRVVHAREALQLELEHVARSVALANPVGDHLPNAPGALQRVPVHAGRHKVVSDLRGLPQDPAAIGGEGVWRVEKEVIFGFLEDGKPLRRRGDVCGHVSPVILGNVVPGYLVAVVPFPALARGTGLLVRILLRVRVNKIVQTVSYLEMPRLPLERPDEEAISPRPRVDMAVVVPHVRQLLSRQLWYLFESEEEVFRGTYGNLDHWVREETQIPGPNSRAVDKVFALDRPPARLHPLHFHVTARGGPELVGRVRDDPLHGAVADEPGAA